MDRVADTPPAGAGMTINDTGSMAATTLTETEIHALVRHVADQIHDPCSMAIGLNVGLAEMGLIREISAVSSPEGWRLRVRLRLTSPGCQYFFSFQEQLEGGLLAHDAVAEARVDWDQVLDWTPGDMAPSVREKIEQRNRIQLRPRASV